MERRIQKVSSMRHTDYIPGSNGGRVQAIGYAEVFLRTVLGLPMPVTR